MPTSPPRGLEATFFVITVGLTLLFVVVAFLAFHTARNMPRHQRAFRALSAVCLGLAGLFLSMTLLEGVFRILIPGGYFQMQPQRGARPDATVEPLPDGQAFWEYLGTFDFDEKGYRGTFTPVDDNAWRWLILGDSVTYGVHVPREENFVNRLHARLAARCGPTDFYDVATPGYSVLQERVALERKGLPVKPHVVLLGLYSNDTAQYTVIGDRAYDIRVKERDGVPVFSLLPLPDALNVFLVTHSVFYQFLTLKGMAALDEATGRSQTQIDTAMAELERIRELTRTHGARLVPVLFPPLGRSLAEPEHKNSAMFYDRVRAWADSHGLPAIDMRKPLARYDLEKIRLDECCHYSPYGHEVVTDVLMTQLGAAGILADRCGEAQP